MSELGLCPWLRRSARAGQAAAGPLALVGCAARARALAGCAAGALALAGCAAGPDFVAPPAPALAHYTPADPAVITGEDGAVVQNVQRGAAVAPRWWQAFGSPALDSLVASAEAGSATLESARATLTQARHALDAARGAAYPQMSVTASAERASAGRRSALDGVGNQFMLGPRVDLDADIFGGTRRRIEQAQAIADYQRAQWQGARLTLNGDTVLQAIALATASAQITAVRDIIAVDQRNVELVRISTEAGKSAQLDVLTAQSQLAADRALLPPLQQQQSAARHAIAVLAGKVPAQWTPPAFDLQAFTLPRDLPALLPSALVRRRPDILGAQAQLHAASAAIGIAQAQRYPNLTLSANWTATAATPGTLFDGASAWSVAASLVAPLFNGGALAAQRAAAVDAYAAQLGNYRQSVLQAFGQVADALETLQYDAAALDAQRNALESAQAALGLTQQSYQAGQASVLQLLDAQRQYQRARLGYVRVLGQRYAGTAQFFIAMGGALPGPQD